MTKRLGVIMTLAGALLAGCGGDSPVSVGGPAEQTESTESAATPADLRPSAEARVGDRTADFAGPESWYDDKGELALDLVPPRIPVCDPRDGCETIIGFVASEDVYPQLLSRDHPVNSRLGYDPGPSEVVDDDGRLVGYLLDVGFRTVEEARAEGFVN
ncbi:MAG: hypothetical protein M3403_06055 [Gemmatimonadota bacterium]|nr:hypothetical protein [Gemmatimonadota bacterium]